MTTNYLDTANDSKYYEILEEVEAIKAIYCQEGEFSVTHLGRLRTMLSVLGWEVVILCVR